MFSDSENIYFYGENCTFINNINQGYSSVLFVGASSTNSVVIWENMNFTRNIETNNGYSVALMQNGHFECWNCLFDNNTGPALAAFHSSTIECYNCTVKNQIAKSMLCISVAL